MTHIPRPYQQEVFQLAIEKARAGESRCLVELATGMGKSFIMAMLGQAAKRPLAIVPSLPILKQFHPALEAHLSEPVDIEQADSRVSNSSLFQSRFMLASKDSLISRDRYKRGAFDSRTIVMVDECHVGMSPKFIEILSHFESVGAFVMGFSATPYRGNGRALPYWGRPAYSMAVMKAIKQHWLVRPKVFLTESTHIDFSELDVIRGDFDEKRLEQILSEEQVVQEGTSLVLQTYKNQSSAVYCQSVNQAKLFAEVFERYGLKVSIVHYRQKVGERLANMNAFKSGETQIIINVDVLGYGWDHPELRNIYNFYPTRSLPRLTQRLGRGTRALKGVLQDGMTAGEREKAILSSDKPFFRFFDYTTSLAEVELKSAVDVLDEESRSDPERRERIRKKAEEGAEEGVDIVEEIDWEQLEEERRKEREKILVSAKFQHEERDLNEAPVKKRRGWRMFWGPYRGELIADLPTDYLRSVVRRSRKWTPLIGGIQKELSRRDSLFVS